MKRALLAALGLAATLGWLALRRAGTARESATAREITTATAERPEGAVALDSGHEQRERAPTGSSPDEAVASATGKVRGRVVLLHTETAVRSGSAQLSYTLPGNPPGPDEATRGGASGTKVATAIDHDGRFGFDLPLGAHLFRLQVSANPNYFERSGPSWTAVDLFAARERPLDEEVDADGVELLVEVEGAVELRGLVRDAESLAPLEGACISTDETSPFPSSNLSARDGSFVLGGLLPGSAGRAQSLRVQCKEYPMHRVALESGSVAAGAPPLIIDLRRGLVVEGFVVDAQQKPVPGVALRLMALGIDAGLDASASVISDRSDARGHFRCSPVAPCTSLVVDIEAGWRDGRDFLALRQDLGALRADRDDLQIELRASGKLVVIARLADGTQLAPRDFDVLCANAPGVETAGYGAEGITLRVPVGVDLELEAYTSANDEHDSEAFVRGKQFARAEAGGPAWTEVTILLGERGTFEVPLPHVGTRELVLPGPSYLHAAVDVRLLDAGTGRPIANGLQVSNSGSRPRQSVSDFRDGWLRIRGRPGTHQIEVEIDGRTRELRDVVIPSSGYAKAEWRVRTGP